MAKKRKRGEEKAAKDDEVKPMKAIRWSDEKVESKHKWVNKQRCLIFSSRGISFRDRHLMNDFLTIMPHSKRETKMDRKDNLFVINEICEMKSCSKCMFFQCKKKSDLYMWLSNIPHGPSAKFMVENVHTMAELKMTGNCLKSSRPILSFSEDFDREPHWCLLKEMFVQTFSTPQYHPRSQPFIDHVFTFTIIDDRIWFRNYQIIEENGELAEIGPRLVLNPIKIFKASFGGETLYKNSAYVTPNETRRLAKRKQGDKYRTRVDHKILREQHREKYPKDYRPDPTDAVFDTEVEMNGDA